MHKTIIVKIILIFLHGFILGSYINLAYADKANSSTNNKDNKDDFSDWQPLTACMVNTKTKASDVLCHGLYQEPSYSYNPNIQQRDFPMQITSDAGEFINKGDSTFLGNVIAKQGNETIYADKAIVRHHATSGELEWIHAIGNFKLTEPGLRVNGTQAEFLGPQDEKIIHNASFRLYSKHIRGEAETIFINNKTKMLLPNASYTTCAPRKKTWILRTKKVRLNRTTGRGEAWHAKLYVRNIPVFYWPYVNFPIDDRRQTGFLQPSYRHSSNDGYTLTVPYYLNLAPNYDATITPSFMTNRKLKLDNNVQYLTAKSNGKIQFNFLPNDKRYLNFVRKNLADPGIISRNSLNYMGLRENDTRYGMSIIHHTEIQQNLFFDVDYTKVGDDNYLYDFEDDFVQANTNDLNTPGLPNRPTYNLGQGLTQASTTLMQQAMLTYRHQLGTVTTKMSQYQTIHPFLGPNNRESYRRLPEIDLQGNPIDLPYKFEVTTIANLTTFKMRDVPFNNILTTGTRYHVKPALFYPYTEAGWFLKPRIQYDLLSYRDTNLSQADAIAGKVTSKTRGIPIYDIDSGLIFERPIILAKNNYTQTLEPRAYYLYVPQRDQSKLPIFDSAINAFEYNQLFRDNRYAGRDRIGDANSVALGIYNRLLKDEGGQEKVNFGIGRILYLRHRTQHLPELDSPTARWSPIAATSSYNLNQHWSINLNLVRERLNKSRSSSITTQYRLTPIQVVNLGYQFERNDNRDLTTNAPLHLRNAKLSSAWAIAPDLRLLGKIDYDLTLKRTNEILAGVEVHSCCTIARIGWGNRRKSTSSMVKENDYIVMLQLVFKGLAGTNNSSQALLRRSIPGYDPNDHEF